MMASENRATKRKRERKREMETDSKMDDKKESAEAGNRAILCSAVTVPLALDPRKKQ